MNPLFAFDGVRHLEEDDLLAPLDACPLCGETDWRPAFAVQQKPDVSLMHCRTCCGASVSRMPAPAVLDVLYTDFYTGAVEEHVTFGNVNRFANHLYRYTRSLVERDALRILDYGGGDGAIAVGLADRMVDAGAARVEVIVADYDAGLATPRCPAVRVGRVDRIDEVARNSADVVLASGVLEHVPDPLGTARHLLERLKPGGFFYARTPHVLPFMYLSRAKAVERFFPFPAHLHDLGQHCWEWIFAQLLADSRCRLTASRPAIVQASFAQYGKIALASYLMKAPWYVLGRRYPFVGGWEVVARKEP